MTRCVCDDTYLSAGVIVLGKEVPTCLEAQIIEQVEICVDGLNPTCLRSALKSFNGVERTFVKRQMISSRD